MKLAVIGGGSTYTPELIDGFARLRHELPLAELVLMDPATARLELIGGLGRRIFEKQGHPGLIRTTADVDDAVDGAAAVLVQLRVGGQAARHRDETWPVKCGCVGQETTGAGGLAKALRTVPIVLQLADRIRQCNPQAWIVDFTNPVGIVTRALLNAGHRAVGLCNVATGLQRLFARLLGVAPASVELDHVGLNHLTWERAVRLVDKQRPGRDMLPALLNEHGPAVAGHLGLPVELLRGLGVVPSYYLRYFYYHDQVVAEQRTSATRASQVAAIEEELLSMYADPDLAEKPALLDRRGGAFYSEAAVALVASLLAGRDDVQVVNVRNDGTLPFLPADAVIEVPARVGHAGARPTPVAPVDPLYAGLIAHTFDYERLALRAVEAGGRARVFSALLAHPLVGQVELAEKLSDELIANNREYLPWA